MDKTLHFNFFFFIVRKGYIVKMAKLKINRFYYRPLPDNLTIGQSEIDGYGIFAKETIGKGVDLGSTHIKVPMIFGYVRTPLGGFVNHSVKNNCELFIKEDWDDYVIYNIVTTKKINKDNEILLNYNN
jgi:hypothetical protein